MSTAHRPTWNPKRGGGGLKDGVAAPPTLQTSSKDQPAHKKLKYNRDLVKGPDHDEHADFFDDDYQAALDTEPHADPVNTDTDSVSSDEPHKDSDQEEEESLSDQEEELMRELAKIRAERQQQKPAASFDGLIQRRWEEEGVVFRKKQAPTGSTKEQGFINDTVRSDQHRAFMEKYVR